MNKKEKNESEELSKIISKRLLDVLPEAVILVDIKGKVVLMNDRIKEWLGYDPKEFIGKRASALPFLSKESRVLVAKNLIKRLAGKKVLPYDVELIAKDGSKLVGRISATIVKNSFGVPVADLIIASNVTTERTSVNRYKKLFENMISGFAYHKMIFDKKGKPFDYEFLEVNKAFEDLTGLKKKNIINKTVKEVIPDITKDPTDWIGIYGNVVKSGKNIKFDSYSETLKRWYSVSAYSPEKDYFVAIFDDITKEKGKVKAESVRIGEIENINELMINRELKMIALKEKIKKLEAKLALSK